MRTGWVPHPDCVAILRATKGGYQRLGSLCSSGGRDDRRWRRDCRHQLSLPAVWPDCTGLWVTGSGEIATEQYDSAYPE